MKRNLIATQFFIFLASFSIAQADFTQLPWARIIEVTQDLPLVPAALDSRAYLVRSSSTYDGDAYVIKPQYRYLHPYHLNKYFNPVTIDETICFLRIDLELPPKPYFSAGTLFSTGHRAEFSNYYDNKYTEAGIEQFLQIGNGIRIECFGPKGSWLAKKFPPLSELLKQFKAQWFMNFTDVPVPVKGTPVIL